MVTATDAGQLSGECTLWRDTLRTFRNRFSNYQAQLLSIAASQSNREVMLEIEHLHNQFHIQLINIHDVKQAVKRHVARIAADRAQRGYVTDDILARHEFLYDEYQRLDTTLHIICREFERFAKYIGQTSTSRS